MLVIFYNSLCIECRQEMAAYKRIHRRAGEIEPTRDALKVLALGVYDSPQTVAAFREQLDVGFPMFPDEKGEIFECLHRGELPVVFLVDLSRGRRIALVRQGHITSPQNFLRAIVSVVQKSTGER